MKAIAVKPPQKNSVHLVDIPKPELNSVANGRGVLVKVLQVGVDATDREVNDGLYGDSPVGDDFLIIGHEVFGQVLEVGDDIGRNDITSEEVYFERGINLRHGFLTEYFVDEEEFFVRVPAGLKHIGVLAEPASVVAKGLEQANLAQQRLQVWQPQTAFVMGSGQIGLLATLMLSLRGYEVFTFARGAAEGNLKAEIATAYGARYVSTNQQSPQALIEEIGKKPDIIFEATGSSRLAFQAMEYLGLNGALIWSSVTGGDAIVDVPADKINLEWVLGNKLLVGTVNGNWKHFEQGIADLSLGEQMFPGVTERILTNPVEGLDNYQEMMTLLESGKALKVFVNVASE
jgi:threonine dehydrogenase-like Zn-dependent dehydrogenase